MQIIEDELAKIFDSEELKNTIKVKKVITDQGTKLIALEEGDLENCIPVIVEIEDIRTIEIPLEYDPSKWGYGYYTTGWSTTGTTGYVLTYGHSADYEISYDNSYTTTLTASDIL